MRTEPSRAAEPGDAAPKAKRSRWRIAGIVAGAIVVTVIAMGAALAANRANTGERLTSTMEYIKRQSLSYDLYNKASVTKSAIRTLENASQVVRNIQHDGGDLSQATLLNYCSELLLTGIVVLDESGSVVAECSTDGVSSADIAQELARQSLINVTDNPEKVYTCRTTLPDDSYVDIAAACRTDAPGTVVALYHTRAEFAYTFNLTLQSLVDGYSSLENGVIVIEREGVVDASNDHALIGASTGDADGTGSAVLEAIRQRGLMDEAVVVHDGQFAYMGSMGRARDYYIYIYTPLSRMLGLMVSVGAVALGIYAAIVALMEMSHRRDEREQLQLSVAREREYNEKLSAAAQQAQAANRAKTEFLQRMSHDIRTPINGIRGMVEVGNAFPDDMAKQAECRKKIWSASELLLGLVNEVLDMSKFEGGDVALEESPVDLRVLLGEARTVVEAQAAERGIALVGGAAHLAHPCVYASPTHLKRLIMNILSNAVKYNKEDGSIQYSIEEISFADGVGTYRFTCADTGIGMSPEFQSHLFEPFAQEQRGQGSYAGTGLGMPITKGLVDLMGGTIDFTSELGVGTTFRIELPLRACDEALCVARASDDGEPAPSIAGMRVLLVEDNDLNREIALFVLEGAGAQVECACDGAQALDVFRASEPGHFDAVLMDIMMPVMDGLAAARAIRALDRPDAATVPIVAMTANAFADDRRASREAGMNDHLAKPLDSKLLIRTLAALREKREEQ